MVMPLVGNLSDTYGRKVMLTVPMTLSIFPLGIYFCFNYILEKVKVHSVKRKKERIKQKIKKEQENYGFFFWTEK